MHSVSRRNLILVLFSSDIVWSHDTPTPESQWIQSRTENFVRHLKNCERQTDAVRTQAGQECIKYGLVLSPNRRRRHEEFTADGALTPSSTHSSTLPISPLIFMGPSPNASPGPILNSSFYPPHYSPISPQEPGPSTGFRSLSVSSAGGISARASPMLSYAGPPAAKRPRTSSGLIRHSSHQELPVWSSTQQQRFASWIARITASCGFPFLWVENPEWIGFCREFIPGAKSINRQSLADRWIPAEVEKYRNAAKENSKGSFVTIQCDGWSGVNFHHYIAFVITTDKREVGVCFYRTSAFPYIQRFLDIHCACSRRIIGAENC